MKRIFLSFVLISIVNLLHAEIKGNGYYRVRNCATQRWATLVDNYANVNLVAGDADLHAMQLMMSTENVLSDPSSIIYLKNLSGNNYDVSAQGVSLESLVNKPISVRKYSTYNGDASYRIYGTYDGAVRYISDVEIDLDEEIGKASIREIKNNTTSNTVNWLFVPVDETTENYFGVVPNLNINGELYSTLYASFPFKPFSKGVKVYIIGRTASGLVELKEITDIVPAGSPVIIKCAGEKASDNKLQIIETTANLTGNSLKGAYFNYTGEKNINRVTYNPQTMRILGKCSDGSLGFITGNIDYIPANTAYLSVSSGSASEFKCIPSEKYDDELQAGVDTIDTESSEIIYRNGIIYSYEPVVIINMAGQTVLTSKELEVNISDLPKGVYIAICGNKTLKFVH